MMLRNYSLNNPVHDRAMDDFIAQERHARSKVEKDLAAYRELLAQLANRLDGQNFETMRQADPGVPANWTPEDWPAANKTSRSRTGRVFMVGFPRKR